jgi:hypothetical protein
MAMRYKNAPTISYTSFNISPFTLKAGKEEEEGINSPSAQRSQWRTASIKENTTSSASGGTSDQ